MKRWYGTLGIGLTLVWGLVFLMTGMPQVQAQTAPNGGAASRGVYLPFISVSPPIPTPTPTPTPVPVPATPRIKQRTGIHMGNRGIGKDWPVAAFELITGTAQGIFPAATVVQSSQLFDFHRSTDPCRIDAVKQVRAPNLYDYLKIAIQQGTIVVIRITPSPGNFIDYAQFGAKHNLRTDKIPAGGNYCNPDNANKFRDISDIANEMEAIYNWFMAQDWFNQGGHQDQLYFEPANEPNNEWYPTLYDSNGKPIAIAPDLQSSKSWRQMDSYFSNLYDLAHAKQPHLQILAPPMGQRKFAEPMFLGKCGFMRVDNLPGTSGYDFMPGTYGLDRFEGYSWHNYWEYGTEKLDEQMGITSTLSFCADNQDYESTSQHLFQFLAPPMLSHIINRNKPVIMTEADVMSPCQADPHNVITMSNRKFVRSHETQISLHDFIANETIATYVIGWLLVQEDDGKDPDCTKGDANYEMAWHEAYTEHANIEALYTWFRDWWTGDED